MSNEQTINDTTEESRIARLEQENEELKNVVKELTERVEKTEKAIEWLLTPARRQPF